MCVAVWRQSHDLRQVLQVLLRWCHLAGPSGPQTAALLPVSQGRRGCWLRALGRARLAIERTSCLGQAASHRSCVRAADSEWAGASVVHTSTHFRKCLRGGCVLLIA